MKRALVTGCSRGIGLEVARMLLAEGWWVMGFSRSCPDPILPELGWLPVDVARGDALEDVLDQAWFRHPLDALIHCAAVQGPVGPLEETDESAWIETIETNLLGTYRVVRAALPLLHRSEDARILLFSGGGAFNPRPNYSAYAASKAGVVSLMETLADELRHTSITINCVAPGYVPTTIHGPDAVPDRGEAMAEAVACVRHLLGPQVRGLTGKTISAPHDDWRHIAPETVARVNASVQGTRGRHPIAMVGRQRMAV